MVGYGADPNRVTEWVREHCDFVIRGNHDRACCGLDSVETFNPAARASCHWTSTELSAENRDYLSALASGPVRVNGFPMVHGSFTDEDEYLIYPQDVAQQGEAEGNPVFFGHTHIQGGFVQFDQKVGRIHPSGDAVELRPDWVHWVNPGSVGQPRDMVWEAGYALYDSEKRLLTYQRCPYDCRRRFSRRVYRPSWPCGFLSGANRASSPWQKSRGPRGGLLRSIGAK